MGRVSWIMLILFFVLASPAQAALITIDPNDFPEETDLSDVGVGAVISSPIWTPITFGSFFPPGVIGKFNPATGTGSCCWTAADILRVDFQAPTDFLVVSFTRGSLTTEWTGLGIIEAFDKVGNLLESAATQLMDPTLGSTEVPLTISRPSADIDHILISEETLTSFDGIRVRTISFSTPEPGTLSLLLIALGALVGASRFPG